jgi:hypothetical protein
MPALGFLSESSRLGLTILDQIGSSGTAKIGVFGLVRAGVCKGCAKETA